MLQEQQNSQEQALARLRELIEEVIGRKMKTPKDFEFLSECIFEKFHEKISPTTLKRIWGYLSESTTPRTSTLDILSKFVGYASWKDFCEEKPIEEALTSPPPRGGGEEASEPCHTLHHHHIIAYRYHNKRYLSSI